MAEPIINPWDRVWNPIRVCDGKIDLVESRLMQPLKWRKPAKIFVSSVFDPFHEDAADEWLDRIFAVMQRSRKHTFKILTKRPTRMRQYVTSLYAEADGNNRKWFDRGFVWPLGSVAEIHPDNVVPFPNVWLGVTAENQEAADARIPDLLATPAEVRFVSCEPMLGEIRLDDIAIHLGAGAEQHFNALFCEESPEDCRDQPFGTNTLDLVISGGESGPHAQPSHPDWFRSLRDQCAAADVAYFHKQNGKWLHESQDEGQISSIIHIWPDGLRSYRVRKARAGRLLDGVEHSAFPVQTEE